MDKSTIVCRCEEITIGDVESAVAQGAETVSDVKRLTRGGMGMCQGKTCQTLISQLIADIKGKPLAEIPAARTRIPLRPIEMGILAANDSGSSSIFNLLADASRKERQGK